MISFFERQTTNVKGATLALEVIVAPLAHRNLPIPMDGDSDEWATLKRVVVSSASRKLHIDEAKFDQN